MKGEVVWVMGSDWVTGSDTPEPGNGTTQAVADGVMAGEINIATLIVHHFRFPVHRPHGYTLTNTSSNY